MREQLTQYVNLLFAGTPDSEDMQQEILQNTLDHYDDLIDLGKSPEAAYRLAIAGIGDIHELLGNDSPVQLEAPEISVEAKQQNVQTNRTKTIMHAIAIALYICCVIPVILLANVGDGILGLCLMFVIIAVATVLIILSSGGDKQKHPENQKLKKGNGIWSTITVVIYLVLSFATQAWHITWLVFPIAGAVEGLVKSLKLSEKSKSMLRAIPYTLLIVILIFILIACLGLRNFPLNLPLSTGTPVEGDVTLDAASVKNLQIDWASGNVTIQTADVDIITIVASNHENTKHKTTYKLDGDTLQLSFSNRIYIFGIEALPSKDLTITVPEDWFCEELEIDGISISIDITGLQSESLSLDGASCTLHYHGSVDQVDIDGASMDIRLNCSNRVSSIEVDGAACTLDLTLPQGCGFVVDVDGLSYGFHTELPITTEGDQKIYGDGHCKISVEGLSCVVTIAEGSPSSSEKPECAHTWDTGTLISNTDICYTCTLCGETYTATDDNLVKQEKYQNAVALAGEGKKGEAAIAFAQLGDYSDAKDRCLTLWSELRQNITISAKHLVAGIRADGTIVTMGKTSYSIEQAKNWTNMCYVSVSLTHILGITADGNVVADGENTYGQCNVDRWQNIVAVCAGENFSVGLTADGNVLYAGILTNQLSEAAGWTGIVQITISDTHIVGLRYDGTVVATGLNDYGQCNVANIENVIHIYADDLRTTLVCADGTLIHAGCEIYVPSGELPSDLVTYNAVADCHYGTTADGRVVCLQVSDTSVLDLNIWQDAEFFFHYYGRLFGLTADGDVILLYASPESEAQNPTWTDMMVP